MPNVTAESKARQRARSGSNLGSSGATDLVSQMERHTWREVEDELIHSVDIAGKVTSLTVYANGACGMQLIVPAAYAHEAMQLVQDSRLMFTFLRAYHVPLPAFLPSVDEDDS